MACDPDYDRQLKGELDDRCSYRPAIAKLWRTKHPEWSDSKEEDAESRRQVPEAVHIDGVALPSGWRSLPPLLAEIRLAMREMFLYSPPALQTYARL